MARVASQSAGVGGASAAGSGGSDGGQVGREALHPAPAGVGRQAARGTLAGPAALPAGGRRV
eukprot:1106262-Lingulodinium_polyedra.AAC.1